MRILTALIALLVISISTGCMTEPRVRAVATPGTDFSKYHTYAIRPGNVVYPGASQAQLKEITQRIQDAVAGELEPRGLTPQPESPDLIVTYTAGAQAVIGSKEVARRAPTGENIREPGGGGYDEPGVVLPRDWAGATEVESRGQYTEGNLVLDLLDGKSRKLVWRATINGEVASDHSGKRLNSAIAKAFKDVQLGNSSTK